MDVLKQLDPNKPGIIITSDENKYNIMRKLSEVEQMFQLPIFSFKEIQTILLGEFDSEAVAELIKYYQENKSIDLNVNVAKKYLKTMLDISSDLKYEEQILNELQTAKVHLENKGLFAKHDFRKNLLSKRQIYIYDVIVPELIQVQLEQISQHSLINLNNTELYDTKYFEFNSIMEEVEYVSNEIAKLVANGIAANKIKLHIPQGEYINVIMMYFSLYNIEHDLLEVRSLMSYTFIKELLNVIKENGVEQINSIAVSNDQEQNLYNQAIDIINRYPSYYHNSELIIKLLTADFEQTKIKSNPQNNVVSQINLEKYMPEDEEYIFCFNFAEGRVPKVKQDTNIISDELASKYNVPTTQEANSKLKQEIIRKINGTKNIVLTYARNSVSGEEAKSSLLNSLELSINEYKDDVVRFSSASDQLARAKADELLRKYDTKHENLIRFKQHDLYELYDNQVTGDLYHVLGEKEINISATSIQKFYECEFKFYLTKMLGVNLQISDPTMIEIGNLYHYVLEKAQKEGASSVEEVREIISRFLVEERVVNPDIFNKPSHKLYLEQYALYLHEIISVIFDFHKRSAFKLDHAEFEAEFKYTLDREADIKLVGKVDKYVELDLDSKFYIVIVDYKTKNNPKISHENFEHGFELQNFIYLNLIKESRGDDEIELIGTYQQRIKPQHLLNHELFNDDFKLFGYTTSAMHKVRQLEPEFANKELSQLANAKTKANGEEFDRYAKIYDEESLENFEKLIKEKLQHVVNRIKKANYQINPKELKGKNVSCDYCDYQAICYRRKQNMIKLEGEQDA